MNEEEVRGGIAKPATMKSRINMIIGQIYSEGYIEQNLKYDIEKLLKDKIDNILYEIENTDLYITVKKDNGVVLRTKKRIIKLIKDNK